MKTAVSLPDPLFRDVERLARRLRISRSELYARALAEYMRSRRGEEITEALNRVYSKESSRLEAVMAEMQWRSIKRAIKRGDW